MNIEREEGPVNGIRVRIETKQRNKAAVRKGADTGPLREAGSRNIPIPPQAMNMNYVAHDHDPSSFQHECVFFNDVMKERERGP